MGSLEKHDPQAQHLPELLAEAQRIPPDTTLRHIYCDLLLRKFTQGISIDVLPTDESKRAEGFSICIEEPTAITGIFFGVNTDFEASLSGGIEQRPDKPTKRMLTELGKERIIQALRFGVPNPL